MRPTKIKGYIDANDKVHEGVIPMLCPTKICSPYGDRWMQTSQDFLHELVRRKDLGLVDFRVFLELNARLCFDNALQISQTEIAGELGIHKQSVNRSVRKLEQLGIILRGPKVSNICTWRLNPHAGWKGKVVELRQAQRDHLSVIQGGLSA